jgi:hypothetical protein
MLRKKDFCVLLIVMGGIVSGSGWAYADSHMDRVLKELDPEERAHQVCTLRGLGVLRRGTHLKRIDRIKSSTDKRALFKNNVVTATSGAVRAGDHWYSLKYKCAVTDDQMKAKSFDFQLGPEIPEDKYEDFGLWK